ncbi:GNAT family N-acetyltransferase [Kaistia sp. 32K]|uniref:GNAT family N-acetyltransferase n=1 Tax=Kaistia sp. 32K TaxID=2795690 RepID=UPI001914E3F0|nr:GNAT family N-acetyltransferase [Kaistia sp. 32K]
MSETSFQIRPVRSDDDLAVVVGMIRAYAASLDIDLRFQDFETEIASMPGKYAPPGGELLLARAASGLPLGCVGLRPLDAEICEMKRLYVAPDGRGLGVGRALVDALVAEARRIGYREMRLDTLPSLGAALALYGKTGFRRIEPYYATPIEGTVFLAKDLR